MMKLSNILLVGSAAAALAACSDQMEYKEYSIYDEAYIKEHWTKVAGFTTKIYNDLDYDFGQSYSGAMLASATDESVYSHSGNQIESFYNGAWSPTNANNAIWNSAWEGISYCNLMLDDFNDLKFEEYLEDKTYAANMLRYNNFQFEARAARAYFYFTLVRQYGSVPLKTANLGSEAANALPQVPVDTIFAFIEKECDAIKDTIMKDYVSDFGSLSLSYTENGRMNDLTVLAIKARAALYYASPLFNPDNDKARWEKAAVATKELLDRCAERNVTLNSSYAALFQTDNWKLSEIIFGRRVAAANSFERYNFPIGLENAGGGNCPTQNLVDAYEMANGLPITDAASGYDPQNPYEGRDPRLSATVAVNGEQWPDANPNLLQTYIGGANGLPTTYATPTGYYLKKYCNPAQVIATSGATTSTHTWVVFRLAEFYLNYAECLLNITGDGYTTATVGDVALDMTAEQAINLVRQRAGIQDLPKNLSQSEFLARYRNERFVELAFEGHRFFDLRRWKIADQYTAIKTAQLTLNADSTITYNYSVDNTIRQWNDKMYLFPIPQSELLKSQGGWVQNAGW